MKIKPKNKKDKEKAKLAEKMLNDWLKNNPGLEEDINKLSVEITMFNSKWGTNWHLDNK